MTNGNDMAYPISAGEGNFAAGLTKREYFAAMAMQGAVAGQGQAAWKDYLPDMIADRAIKYADALIAALNTEAK